MKYSFVQISKNNDVLTGVFIEKETGRLVTIKGRLIQQALGSVLTNAKPKVDIISGAPAKKYLKGIPIPSSMAAPAAPIKPVETVEERFARVKAKMKQLGKIPEPLPPIPPQTQPMPLPVSMVDYGEVIGSPQFVIFNPGSNECMKPKRGRS